ncbi:MAG TPA: M48 family metalloprotease [Pyrinomonadaceae bacterium]|nr:M48 family metalloprotease [Pyrinomonadaceae bacterium]
MEEKEFSALVDRLESYARVSPGGYKLRVALLAALGYVFLIGVVVAIVVLVLTVIYFAGLNWLVVKVLLIPLGLAAIVLRSLWIEIPEPEGHELGYEDAPRLFDLAKTTREATSGPRLHKVLLTDDFNAAIMQRPRLGMFGWHENYLIVGLPLLRGMSPDEVRAVITHEFGHLSGKHGVFSGWIYRVRLSWAQIVATLRQEERFGSAIFESFFNWYAPYFAAYSYVLARSREYEADRTAVQLCGKENAARALIKAELRDKSLNEEFWPAFFERAGRETDVPKETFTEMLSALRQPIAPEKAQLWFSQSLTLKHSYDDTHPALGDRLEAIGYPDIRTTEDLKPFLKEDEHWGDEYFLQTVPADFIASKNRLWRDNVAQIWRERKKSIAEAHKTLATLEEKAKSEQLTLEESSQRARIIYGTQGYEAALPLFQELVALNPDSAEANYNLGAALVEHGDEAGIKNLEIAMRNEVHTVPPACELIYKFLSVRKRREEAETYRQRAADYYKEVELAEQERTRINASDQFKPHALEAEVIRKLHDQLSNHPDVAMAYLVRKVVQHFSEQPLYVLGIIVERLHRFGTPSEAEVDQRLVEKLAEQVNLPGSVNFILVEKEFAFLRKILEQVEGSEIYRAERYKANTP